MCIYIYVCIYIYTYIYVYIYTCIYIYIYICVCIQNHLCFVRRRFRAVATDGTNVAPSQRHTCHRSPALHRGAARCNSRRACDALMLREEFLRDSEQRNAKLVEKNQTEFASKQRTLRTNEQTNTQTNNRTNWRLTTCSTAGPRRIRSHLAQLKLAHSHLGVSSS